VQENDKLNHYHKNYDLTTYASYAELVSAFIPIVLIAWIKQANHGKITLTNTNATRTNTLLFDATRTLRYARKEEYEPIKKEKRGKREAIKAAREF
jgi:hypothetical protein